MATLCKNRARKLTAMGPISVGYVNLSYPLLSQKQHVALNIGDYVLRVEIDQAQKLVDEINAILTIARSQG